MKSRRGAPKRIDTEGFACPNPQCRYFGNTDAHFHALVGDGKHGRAEPIQTFRCQACRTTFTARRNTPLYRLKTPSQKVAMVRICAGRRAGPFRGRAGLRLPSGHHHHLADPRGQARCSSCMSAASAICASRICSWTNCAPGCAALHRCCGCGWPSTPCTKILPVLQLGPRTQNMAHRSSTPATDAWLLAASRSLPVMDSNLYFYALTAHFGQWLQVGVEGAKCSGGRWRPRLIYGQVKKSYRRRKLVRVTQVMRLGTEDALKPPCRDWASLDG